MIDNDFLRGVVNAQMKRLVRMFEWAASEGKMPASIYETLRLVPGLKRGRTEARETSPVMPVPPEAIAATLKHLPPTIAAMVNLQWLAGCRPGEICRLTPGMIEREGDVWGAVLGEHKTAHHGHERNLYLGPKAQALVTPYLDRGADDCLFRPCDTVRKQRAKAAANRTTPPSCGNREGTNRKKAPKRSPGVQYDPIAYGRAIKRAAEKAGVEHWTPNQLRHTRGTEVRKLFGLEAAQVVLGHAGADVTQVYAERDAEKAEEVALQIG